MKKLIFISVCILTLNSCSILKAVEKNDTPDIVEPFMAPLTDLSDYIEKYGKTDGVVIYYNYLEEYITYLQFFQKRLNEKYSLRETAQGCAFEPNFSLFVLPELPTNLEDLDHNEMLIKLMEYISNVESSVKTYNISVLDQLDEFEKCKF